MTLLDRDPSALDLDHSSAGPVPRVAGERRHQVDDRTVLRRWPTVTREVLKGVEHHQASTASVLHHDEAE